MNMTIIIVAAVFTAFEFLSIIGKASDKWLKRVLGYEYVIDIIMSFGMMFYFSMIGSITGIIVSAITGFIFSAFLYSAKHIVGYSKLHHVKGLSFEWVTYEGNWSMEGAGGLLGRVVRRIINGSKSFVSGVTNEKHVAESV